MARMKSWYATVTFSVGREVYGREAWTITAPNRAAAAAEAGRRAASSRYDDDRIPDRRVRVSVVGLSVPAPIA